MSEADTQSSETDMAEVQTLDQLHAHVTDALGDRDDVVNIRRAVGRCGPCIQVTVNANMLYRSFWEQCSDVPYSTKSVCTTLQGNRLLFRVRLFL